MDSLIDPLMPLFRRERAAGRSMVLAVVLATAGSTYSKQGTPLLIADNGEIAGLISGGCLEGDLQEHARRTQETGIAQTIRYDTRGPDDQMFGLGLGCEGAMDIFLMKVGELNGWQPLSEFHEALKECRTTAVGLVVRSTLATLQIGDVLLPGRASAFAETLDAAVLSRESTWLLRTEALLVFGLPLVLPPRLLLLGAGPDTLPVIGFARELGWRVTLYDHRPAYVADKRLPAVEGVFMGRPEALASTLPLVQFDAAVVMSHQLDADAAYLRALAATNLGYVGLLGPAPRRERLRAMLGSDFAKLRGRLRAPIGIPLGGRSSAAVALAIVAEIHYWLHHGRIRLSAQAPLPVARRDDFQRAGARVLEMGSCNIQAGRSVPIRGDHRD
jgi:xanthine dehydrogenase accessory factor